MRSPRRSIRRELAHVCRLLSALKQLDTAGFRDVAPSGGVGCACMLRVLGNPGVQQLPSTPSTLRAVVPHDGDASMENNMYILSLSTVSASVHAA